MIRNTNGIYLNHHRMSDLDFLSLVFSLCSPTWQLDLNDLSWERSIAVIDLDGIQQLLREPHMLTNSGDRYENKKRESRHYRWTYLRSMLIGCSYTHYRLFSTAKKFHLLDSKYSLGSLKLGYDIMSVMVLHLGLAVICWSAKSNTTLTSLE